MTTAFDKYMEAARRRAARRPPATKITLRKNGTFSVIKRGRVVQSGLRTVDELDAFLCGYDPALAERRARAASGWTEAKIQSLLADPPPGFMELAGAGIERPVKPVITFVALTEPDTRK